MEVSKTGVLSRGLYVTRTGKDEAEQHSKQVFKVLFHSMDAVRLEQHKGQKDEVKILIMCVDKRTRKGSYQVSSSKEFHFYCD